MSAPRTSQCRTDLAFPFRPGYHQNQPKRSHNHEDSAMRGLLPHLALSVSLVLAPLTVAQETKEAFAEKLKKLQQNLRNTQLNLQAIQDRVDALKKDEKA